MVFTCTACQETFTVPWFEDYPIPEEMFTVIEHEDAHTANGEKPGWELKVVEGGT